MQKIINGDCLIEMHKMADNSIDCVLTDPPYGIGFMNKEWDKSVIGVEYWKEALRICKPGAPILVFSGTRTYHRLTCAIEDAGFQIRDCLMWIYGSGFPKSKACLKPAYEPIILAMKKDKYIHHLNIDECRIESFGEHIKKGKPVRSECFLSESKGMFTPGRSFIPKNSPLGRWPANILFDEEAAQMLGSPSRFFYCAKASSKERVDGGHPTVKPLKLMEYLLKLIIPPNPEAIVLDPFLGSGTTLLAAKNLGFNAIGIEVSKEYCEIAEKRCGRRADE